jgi:hypothetical protein
MNKQCRMVAVTGLALALVLASAPLAGGAQNLDPTKPYALIFGTVFGPDDRPLANVKIKIRRGDHKRAKWELVSDRRGEFAQRFAAGEADYFIDTDIPKKYRLENKEVKVHIMNDERQDIALHLTKVATKERTKENKD